MRQVAIDAAAIPKDARIAALERSSADAEKMIADARSDKLRTFEEMQNSQVRGHAVTTTIAFSFCCHIRFVLLSVIDFSRVLI